MYSLCVAEKTHFKKRSSSNILRHLNMSPKHRLKCRLKKMLEDSQDWPQPVTNGGILGGSFQLVSC